MSSREFILNKLKNIRFEARATIPAANKDIDIFSDYPNRNSLLELFEKRFKALNGELHSVNDIGEAGQKLNSILSSIEEKKCITFSSNLTNKVISSTSDLQRNFDVIDHNYLESQKLATYSIGITTADLLVARTGSIVLNSLNHGGRRLSVLPLVHIVLAKSSQTVFSLDDIFRNAIQTQNWSYATIISGPSRTSDIEKQLVLGAHGPKRLILILIENI